MKTKNKKVKFNIKKGSMVVVISGNDKNLTAPKKVLRMIVDKSRVVVEGVNMVSRHTKPNAQHTQGGIIKKEAPIHISNVMLWDGKQGTRINRQRTENGKLQRISKKSGQVIA
ncbi:MAG: 50S ribosomal protein L24 [Chitinophagaceae bacterium]